MGTVISIEVAKKRRIKKQVSNSIKTINNALYFQLSNEKDAWKEYSSLLQNLPTLKIPGFTTYQSIIQFTLEVTETQNRDEITTNRLKMIAHHSYRVINFLTEIQDRLDGFISRWTTKLNNKECLAEVDAVKSARHELEIVRYNISMFTSLQVQFGNAA